ncbi:MAG: biotin--[acetyl-CoA-carboxylase] ligase [Gammaproteobacteria bacterium]|nr:biotin--[acetyl-CoA-carboxylase] ligase [Gammaproteobacteria bacterium]
MSRRLPQTELLALVDALADGGWKSGPALAQAAGVTRAALAKRIARLQDWQLIVERRHGVGYRLAAPIERLQAQRIRALLPQPWRERLPVTVQPVIDSTNSALAQADPAADPQALLTELQTAGRGRRGRRWRSPFGANLYLSLAWSFAGWPPQLSALPLAAGIACMRALRRAGVDGVLLKWPNDLYARGVKLGGVLVESRAEGAGACRAVVGVGLNVSMTDDQAGVIDQPWITVDELQRSAGRQTVGRNALAAALLAELCVVLEAYATEGFAPLAAEWDAADAVVGRRVRIDADPPLEGVVRGIDDAGALRLETTTGVVAVSCGDVSLRG